MNTWEQICRSISGIEHLDHIYKNVIVCKGGRSQVMAIWIYRGYDQENGHTCKKCLAQEKVFIFIFKIKIAKAHCNVGEP